MAGGKGQNPESVVREIRRKTRRKFSIEEKIRIVLEGLKGEASIAELCRREGIVPNPYYRWSKAFLETGRVYENAVEDNDKGIAVGSGDPTAQGKTGFPIPTGGSEA